MKKQIWFLIVFLLFQSCNLPKKKEFRKEIFLGNNEFYTVQQMRFPTTVEITNLLNEKVKIESTVKMPTEIAAKSGFVYRLPKKTAFTFRNESGKSAAILMVIKPD